MFTRTVIALGTVALASSVHAAEFEYLGIYSNVTLSSESKDCDGFDIELWATSDGTKSRLNVTGLFRLVDGSCDMPPRPIFNGHIILKTGELTFDVPISESPIVSVGYFKGRMKDRMLNGTLTLRSGSASLGRFQEIPVSITKK